jgi:hypothetical protein
MSLDVPTLKIGEDARPYVHDAYLNGEVYATYLASRNAPEPEIANLTLIITNRRLPKGAIASFSPASYLFGQDNHLIKFSPTKMFTENGDQGDVLRHESEHFLQFVKDGGVRSSACRTAALASLATAGALLGGFTGHEIAAQTSVTLQD